MKRKDYCPHCRERTEHIKDYDYDDMLCKKCGKKEKRFKAEEFNL